MQADAYRRARRLLSGSSGAVMARVLGVLHSLLVLALLTVLGLLISLLATRGVARYSTDRKDESPAWLAQKMGGQDARYTYYRDSGLFPLVAANRRSTNPAHRAAARGLRGVLRWIPILRNNNLGALTTLLATGLGLWLVHCVLAHHRRTLLAEAANAPATTLRRQIHRQMYRLGQSSLPTEGTGPADNLLTRAVNDVRDGIFAELDNAFRIPVLAAGLAGIALFLSVPLTFFLASLGALVWITARVMDRDARLVSDAAMRDAALQLCLLHEDLALLRTVRVYGMEDIDRQRFDAHLGRYREADARRIKAEGRLNPTIGLLYGCAAALAIGLLGHGVAVNQSVSIASALVLARISHQAIGSGVAGPSGGYFLRSSVIGGSEPFSLRVLTTSTPLGSHGESLRGHSGWLSRRTANGARCREWAPEMIGCEHAFSSASQHQWSVPRQLRMDAPEHLRIRATARQVDPHLPHRHLDQRPDLQQLQPHRLALRLSQFAPLKAQPTQRIQQRIRDRGEEQPDLVGPHRAGTGAVGEQVQLLLLDPVLRLAAAAVVLLI